MVVALRHLAVSFADKLSVVSYEYEYCIVEPWLSACLTEEFLYLPVCIFHNLFFYIIVLRVEILRYHVWRMVAD